MTKRTFILSLLTSLFLLLGFYVSQYIGHQQSALALTSVVLFIASCVLFIQQHTKQIKGTLSLEPSALNTEKK